MRLAAVGDIHCTARSSGKLRELFRQMAGESDTLLLCGDLTDYGLPEEAETLAEELMAASTRSKVAVLGNHDFESGKEGEIRNILAHAGVTVLDGGACLIDGFGFAGVKGFGGGFLGHPVEAWGESSIKHFVQESANEGIKLDAALARLESRPRIVLLHYSPIRSTVEGESPEIYAFLGSMRLEEPLLRHEVDAVFHGHAHHGCPEGRTRAGTPVYNVAMPLLKALFPDRPPFRVVEVDAFSALQANAAGEPQLDAQHHRT